MTIGNETQKTVENLKSWMESQGMVSSTTDSVKEYLNAVGGDYAKFESLSESDKQSYLKEVQIKYDAQFVTLNTGEKVKKTDYDTCCLLKTKKKEG